MQSIMTFLFIIGALLLVGMIHYFLAHQRPGIYPPKRILKQRAVTLGGVGTLFIILGLLFMASLK